MSVADYWYVQKYITLVLCTSCKSNDPAVLHLRLATRSLAGPHSPCSAAWGLSSPTPAGRRTMILPGWRSAWRKLSLSIIFIMILVPIAALSNAAATEVLRRVRERMRRRPGHAVGSSLRERYMHRAWREGRFARGRRRRLTCHQPSGLRGVLRRPSMLWGQATTARGKQASVSAARVAS